MCQPRTGLFYERPTQPCLEWNKTQDGLAGRINILRNCNPVRDATWWRSCKIMTCSRWLPLNCNPLCPCWESAEDMPAIINAVKRKKKTGARWVKKNYFYGWQKYTWPKQHQEKGLERVPASCFNWFSSADRQLAPSCKMWRISSSN